MNEATWLANSDPGPMLELVQGRSSERRLRLFSVACCRRIWHLIVKEPHRQAVEVAERFADGEAADEEREAVHQVASRCAGAGDVACRSSAARAIKATSAAHAASATASLGALHWYDAREAQEKVWQAHLCRDVFSNPFRPLAIEPAWRTPDAVTIATAAYEERSLPSGVLDNARLAILADALEEAGATGALLEHLRSLGPHVRGCFAVDAVRSVD